jgi:hypothetical protein
MSAAEKQPYLDELADSKRRKDVVALVEFVAANDTTARTPWGLGDNQWPIRKDIVSDKFSEWSNMEDTKGDVGILRWVHKQMEALVGKMVNAKSAASAATWQYLTRYYQANKASVATLPCWQLVQGMCVNDDAHRLPYVLGIVRLLNVFSKGVPKADEGKPLLRLSCEDFVMFVHQGKIGRSPQKQTYIAQRILDDDKAPLDIDYMLIYARVDGELPLRLIVGTVQGHDHFNGYFSEATNWELATRLSRYSDSWVLHRLKYACLDAERSAVCEDGMELVGDSKDYISSDVPGGCGSDEMTDAFRAMTENVARPPPASSASSSSHGENIIIFIYIIYAYNNIT